MRALAAFVINRRHLRPSSASIKSSLAIDAPVCVIHFYRNAGRYPYPLHPFPIRQPWAILIFVHHPRRQQRLITAEFPERYREFELNVGVDCLLFCITIRNA